LLKFRWVQANEFPTNSQRERIVQRFSLWQNVWQNGLPHVFFAIIATNPYLFIQAPLKIM
jgi:hypothetical protein